MESCLAFGKGVLGSRPLLGQLGLVRIIFAHYQVPWDIFGSSPVTPQVFPRELGPEGSHLARGDDLYRCWIHQLSHRQNVQ